jgi:hypothetical protein
MPTFRPFPVLVALSAVTVAIGAAEGVAEEFQCRRGDLVRRIEVQFANRADRLPCEVIYWKDDEAPGRPEQLWNAEHEIAFCTEKAREMVARLESAGWACAPRSGGAEGPTRTATTPSSERPSPQPRDSAPAHATGRPDRATLRAALARDIRRLDQLTAHSSGGFATDTATLGDLNGDGIEDAAVLLTHRGDGVAPSHYLVAYLFDGETFQPVARINLGAFYQNVTEVGIEDVEGGAVDLLLRMARAGDPQCCPSGRRQATFGLRDRQLVLLRESEPGA